MPRDHTRAALSLQPLFIYAALGKPSTPACRSRTTPRTHPAATTTRRWTPAGRRRVPGGPSLPLPDTSRCGAAMPEISDPRRLWTTLAQSPWQHRQPIHRRCPSANRTSATRMSGRTATHASPPAAGRWFHIACRRGVSCGARSRRPPAARPTVRATKCQLVRKRLGSRTCSRFHAAPPQLCCSA